MLCSLLTSIAAAQLLQSSHRVGKGLNLVTTIQLVLMDDFRKTRLSTRDDASGLNLS